ncbi:MAG TPA: TIGR01777 family oxidoreductase [Terriglobales bacterium]|nr:TIGR01777 family oxidoreductase [Terriglobales bacterium]
MKILLSGATGLIGSALIPALQKAGYEVIKLVRRAPSDETEIVWDPTRAPDQRLVDRLSGFDGVIHLAGETIMGRWTAEKKARIRDSRTIPTRNLCSALASASAKPRVLLSASAIGIYGNRGDEVLTEESAPGSGFLAEEVAVRWEQATEAAREAGIRVVNLRIGVVLTPKGGALKEMLLPFRMGVGGKTGSGRQWMSWIALEDVVSSIVFLLVNESIAGPVNLTAPKPVTNAEFSKALASTMRRPAVFSQPAFLIRTIFGEMGETLLLGSTRVLPRKLEASGYRFKYSEVNEALRAMVGER